MIFHVVHNGKIDDGGFDDDDNEEEDEDEDDNVRDAHKGQLTVLLTILAISTDIAADTWDPFY